MIGVIISTTVVCAAFALGAYLMHLAYRDYLDPLDKKTEELEEAIREIERNIKRDE